MASVLPVLILALASVCLGLPKFLPRLPNGGVAGDATTGLSCHHLGHNDCKAGAPRNQFGLDFDAGGRSWTKELCEKDSDGDGVTNGEEMGDPCCLWTAEVKDTSKLAGFRSKDLSHPGVKGETNSVAKCPAKSEGGASSAPTTTATGTAETGSGDDDDDDVCFPASAVVETPAGPVAMENLSIGDRVRVGDGSFSTVFMFTHKDFEARHGFVKISTAAGRAITATAGHYVLVGGGMVAAGGVRVGDVMTMGEGGETQVVAVERVFGAGLYNPQTLDGRIVVDGLVASTYTKAVEPGLAHAALAPLRTLYRAMEVGGSLDDGSPVGIRQWFGGATSVA